MSAVGLLTLDTSLATDVSMFIGASAQLRPVYMCVHVRMHEISSVSMSVCVCVHAGCASGT